MSDMMAFPDTVEEFMENYKIVDTDEVYTNGAELVPIFRMKQWFEHLPSAQPERKTGRWIPQKDKWGDYVTTVDGYVCSECNNFDCMEENYCPNCGERLEDCADGI